MADNLRKTTDKAQVAPVMYARNFAALGKVRVNASI